MRLAVASARFDQRAGYVTAWARYEEEVRPRGSPNGGEAMRWCDDENEEGRGGEDNGGTGGGRRRDVEQVGNGCGAGRGPQSPARSDEI
jgi:hypothetical protein